MHTLEISHFHSFQQARLSSDGYFQDALHISMCAVYQLKGTDGNQRFSYSKGNRIIADDLLYHCAFSSGIYDLLDITKIRWAEFSTVNGNVELHYSSDEIAQGLYAEAFFGGRNVIDRLENDENLIDLNKMYLDSCAKACGRLNEWFTNAFPITKNNFDEVYSHWKRMKESSWEFGVNWLIADNVTIGDFNVFWLTLSVLVSIHQYRWLVYSKSVKRVIPVFSRKNWHRNIARFSGLSDEKVSTLIDMLTLDMKNFSVESPKHHVVSQPFVSMQNFRGDGVLAVCPSIVRGANAERNMWNFLWKIDQDRVKLAQRLCEGKWTLDLKSKYESKRLLIIPDIPIGKNASDGNVDIIFIDAQTKFALACELKWMVDPATNSDIKTRSETIREAIGQARTSKNWLESRTPEVVSKTGIVKDDIGDYQFEAMVVSKNTLGAFVETDSDIPVLNDILLNWFLDMPLSLKDAWSLGRDRKRFMPKENYHFKSTDSYVALNTKTIKLKGFGMTREKQIDPKHDIETKDLVQVKKIAFLGWGSLLWDHVTNQEFDKWHEEWQEQHGPVVRLEFSKISKSRLGALTLVVDFDYGTPCNVAWSISRRTDIHGAVSDLSKREGGSISYIKVEEVDVYKSEPECSINMWARERFIDYVVWTGLSSDFERLTSVKFSPENASQYIQRLDDNGKRKAAEYIRRAPGYVVTNLRNLIQAQAWFQEIPD